MIISQSNKFKRLIFFLIFFTDTKTLPFNKNSEFLGDRIMSLDLYKNMCEKTSKNSSISKPKLCYNYYYDHYIKTRFKSLLKIYDSDISVLL